MVSLVREMLKYIKLKEIVNGILKVNKVIKFRSVKQLISDVFWDKRAMVDICKSATSISYNELKETQDEFFNTKADGLSFQYDKCKICEMQISKTSLRLMNSVSIYSSNNRSKDHNLIMFDCSKENNFNHAFHESCLKKYIKEELKRNKKASLRELDVLRVYRCVICYKQSQSINGEGPPKTVGGAARSSRLVGRSGGRATPNNRPTSEVSDNGSSTSQNSATFKS
jgi:hypothetical protein